MQNICEYDPMPGTSVDPKTQVTKRNTIFTESSRISNCLTNEQSSGIQEDSGHECPIIGKSKINILNRCFGKGSYGKVYLGHIYNQKVAIKKLYPQFLKQKTLNNEVKYTFENEVNDLSKVKSHHCVSLYGISTDPPLIVLEYCPNGSLYSLLEYARKNPKSIAAKNLNAWEMRLAIALDISHGMLYLHGLNKPIIHGDLKSPNILIDENGNAKVTDYGLYRFINSEENENDNNTDKISCLSPLWASPEVLENTSFISKKSDVFSFGIVLWELLTFKHPYSILPYDKHRLNLIRNYIINHNSRPEIYKERNRFPGNWDPILEEYINLIRDCWKKDPLDRPQFYEINRRLLTIKMKMFPLKFQESKYGSNPSFNIYTQENKLVTTFQHSNDSKLNQSSCMDLNKYCSVKGLLYLMIVLLFILIALVLTSIIIRFIIDDDDNDSNNAETSVSLRKIDYFRDYYLNEYESVISYED